MEKNTKHKYYYKRFSYFSSEKKEEDDQEEKPSATPTLSIFNKVDVNVKIPINQKQEVEIVGDKKTDGCVDCFKSVFSCFKK